MMIGFKKFFGILTSLIIFNAGFAISSERPEWSEFCPLGLEDAEYKEIQWFWPDGTKSTQNIYNYWAKRRVEFQDSVAECAFSPEDFQEICYDNVRSKQLLTNELYNKDLQNKKIKQQVWKESYYRNSNSVMINLLR